VKSSTLLLCALIVSCFVRAQTALPEKTFQTLRDSTNSIDIVFMLGKGGSMNIEGRNVLFFNSFFDNTTAPKTTAKQAGLVMWQINGREFLSGNFHLGDSTGYIVFQKDGKEYVNKLNAQGNTFLKNQIKQ
jgi:hypothetical protein